MVRPGRKLLAFIGAGLLAIMGCAGRHPAGEEQLLEPAGVQIHAVRAERGNLREVMQGVGVVVPGKVDYVYSPMDGNVSRIHVQAGDEVSVGQSLAALDSGISDLNLLQQQLAYERAKLALNEASSSGKEETIRMAVLNREIEGRKLDRMSRLREQETIRSPANGKVVFVDRLQPGDPVDAYQELIGIAPNEQLQVRYLGEVSSYASRLRMGMPVELIANGSKVGGSLADAPWTLANEELRIPEEVLGRMLLFDMADGLPQHVGLGDFVEFRILLSEKEDALTIPRGALRNSGGLTFARVIRDGIVVDAEVKPGLILSTKAEIMEGLVEGEQVVVFP